MGYLMFLCHNSIPRISTVECIPMGFDIFALFSHSKQSDSKFIFEKWLRKWLIAMDITWPFFKTVSKPRPCQMPVAHNLGYYAQLALLCYLYPCQDIVYLYPFLLSRVPSHTSDPVPLVQILFRRSGAWGWIHMCKFLSQTQEWIVKKWLVLFHALIVSPFDADVKVTRNPFQLQRVTFLWLSAIYWEARQCLWQSWSLLDLFYLVLCQDLNGHWDAVLHLWIKWAMGYIHTVCFNHCHIWDTDLNGIEW